MSLFYRIRQLIDGIPLPGTLLQCQFDQSVYTFNWDAVVARVSCPQLIIKIRLYSRYSVRSFLKPTASLLYDDDLWSEAISIFYLTHFDFVSATRSNVTIFMTPLLVGLLYMCIPIIATIRFDPSHTIWFNKSRGSTTPLVGEIFIYRGNPERTVCSSLAAAVAFASAGGYIVAAALYLSSAKQIEMRSCRFRQIIKKQPSIGHFREAADETFIVCVYCSMRRRWWLSARLIGTKLF